MHSVQLPMPTCIAGIVSTSLRTIRPSGNIENRDSPDTGFAVAPPHWSWCCQLTRHDAYAAPFASFVSAFAPNGPPAAADPVENTGYTATATGSSIAHPAGGGSTLTPPTTSSSGIGTVSVSSANSIEGAHARCGQLTRRADVTRPGV